MTGYDIFKTNYIIFLCFFQVLLRIIGGLNMLRGFFIFLVFIFKSSVWEMIKKKHPRLSSCLSLIFVCNSTSSSTSQSNDNVELMRLDQTRQTSDTATKHHQLTHGQSFDTKIEVIATPVWKMSNFKVKSRLSLPLINVTDGLVERGH